MLEKDVWMDGTHRLEKLPKRLKTKKKFIQKETF